MSNYGKREECTEQERQIRSTPDFIVFDPEKYIGEGIIEEPNMMLVEVKTRTLFDPNKSNFLLYPEEKKDFMEDYLKYWTNALMVIVVPGHDFFYVQAMKKLQPFKPSYNGKMHFQKFQKFFPRVSDETMKKYQPYVKEIFSRY